MKVLICVFLALAVDLINCHSYGTNWLSSGGSPSYSYDSSPSWGYGSSLYGASYGSGLGYGSGGISYGSGLGGGSTYYTTSHSPAVTYQTARYSYLQPADGGGYAYNEAPENIAFPLGGTGYQTGKSIDAWTSPLVPNIAQGVKGFEAPTKVIYTQDFSKHSGQFQRPREVSEVLAFQKTNTPLAVISEKTALAEDARSFHAPGGVSLIHFQEIGGRAAHGSADSGYRKTVSPVTLPKPANAYRPKVSAVNRGGQWTGTAVAPGKITFTQDFSRVAGRPGSISAFDKAVAPARTLTDSFRTSSGRYGGPGAIRKTGFLGGTGGQSQVSFTRGVPSGQVQPIGGRPAIVRNDPVRTPVIARPFVGQSVSGALPQRKVQNLSPARISFTRDFPKVVGHQTSVAFPVVPNLDKPAIPAFPGTVSTSGYKADRRNILTASKPAQKPITTKLDWKTSKQPITQEPGFTTLYEQAPVQEGFGNSAGHTADKSIFSTRPVTAISGVNAADYKQEIITGFNADKQSTVFNVPAAGDKSSTYKNSAVSGQGFRLVGGLGDRAGDKSSALLQSHGIKPTVSFVEEKGALFPAGVLDAAVSDDGQNRDSISMPFRSYHSSSSYPGYSQVSGESPRFEFSPDRSLLYSYGSPQMVSPFSYLYSSGKGQYQEINKKAA